MAEFLNTPTAKKEMTKCMAKKIYLDAGHGGNDPGAVGYVVERKVAVKVVKYMKEYLQKNYVCKLKLSKGTAALSGRCREANNWKADLFVSVHFNAGGGDGYEALVYSAAGEKLGRCFEKHVKAVKQNSRGVKYRPDLAVLRLTNMKSILNEVAFVDNRKDIKDWDENRELKVMGEALAKAAAEWLNLPAANRSYITQYSMNLRKSPSTKSAAAGKVSKGKTVTGTVEGSWLKTDKGYIRSEGEKVYLKEI